MIGLHHYLILAALLFVCGLLTIGLRRNAIGILIGVEMILNAAALNLVAINRLAYPTGSDGQLFALFVIVLAAAEAAVVLALVLKFNDNAKAAEGAPPRGNQ